MGSALEDVFLLFNTIQIATTSAITPITPRPAPNPIPALAPVESSSEEMGAADVETALGVLALVFNEFKLPVVIGELVDMLPVVIGELVNVLPVVDGEMIEVCSTFQPTTAIAPTYDL